MTSIQEEAQRIISPEILAAINFRVHCATHGQISVKLLSYPQAVALKSQHARDYGCALPDIDLQDK